MINGTFSAVGQGKSWSLIQKLGEGDAGEVFLVESILEHRKAILKRPRKSAFSSDIIRQATQIENEGKILRKLNGLRMILPRNTGLPRVDIRTPLLVDQSQTGSEFSDRFFIVIEQAQGLDLSQLERVLRLGASSLEKVSPTDSTFLRAIADSGKVPDLILLRVLAGLLLMFEATHSFSRADPDTAKSGLVWNDVKPEHIFWEPASASLTVIDWGNGQFLESDGYDKERRISKNNDYAQFFQTFSAYITNTNPELLDKLKWPADPKKALSYSDLIKPIKTRLAELLKQEQAKLNEARQAESSLIRSYHPEPGDLDGLFETQQAILDCGEMPDFTGADHFCTQMATRLAHEGKIAEFKELSTLSFHFQVENQAQWQALADIARIAEQEGEQHQEAFQRAISAGLIGDWPSALWDLLSTTADEDEPTWWDEVSSLIRQTGLGIEPDKLPPLIVLKRNILLMQAAVQKERDRLGLEPLGAETTPRKPGSAAISTKPAAGENLSANQNDSASGNAAEADNGLNRYGVRRTGAAYGVEPETSPNASSVFGVEPEIQPAQDGAGAALPGQTNGSAVQAATSAQGLNESPGANIPNALSEKQANELVNRYGVRRTGAGYGGETGASAGTASGVAEAVKSEDNSPSERQVRQLESMIKLLREDVALKWEEVEPDPPDSGLPYSDIERFMVDIGGFFPEVQQALQRSLEGPNSQVRLIREAWERQDMLPARKALRQLLMWDPDRRRVLAADRAILRSQRWLEKVRKGPQNEQAILDFIADLEFGGRELRNQVAPAGWLDIILDFFAQYRKGRKIAELLVETPDASRLMPWLAALEPTRYTPNQPAQAIPLERLLAGQAPEPTIRGMQEGAFGPDQELLLADPLDTWAPEARGSSARAFVGFLRSPAGQIRQAAVKVMRNERLEYALPLFREEVVVLNIMQDVPGLAPMLECGFMQLANQAQLPPDNRPLNARGLSGSLLRYGPEQVGSFLSVLETRAHQGWLPYIILPKLDNQDNLMWSCDIGFTHGRFLPVEQCLRLSVQICDILNIAHERNIVYRDHKLLHYYWLELYNGVFMIDWNVARYHPEGLSQAEIQFDLVQLGARALHHIFTGRVAPGALADGPNKVEEIESAAKSYGAQWTYDDQRLPPSLKAILEQLLDNEYTKVSVLKKDLMEVYQELTADSR